MKRLQYLRQIIGQQTALVIVCIDCWLDFASDDKVFVYTSLGNMLHTENEFQQDNIRYYVEEQSCSQIVIVGHTYCRALNYILGCECRDSPVMKLKSNLKMLLALNHSDLLLKPDRQKMLVEQNVIQQGRQLLSFDFVGSRVEQGRLSIVGLVMDEEDKNKIVFQDGFVVNDLISMN